MTYLLKRILAPLVLLAVIGGCTVVTEGPKFLWGVNVKRRAIEMGRVCLGASGLGHIANPITWFIAPPNSYWFTKADQVSEHNYLKGIWVVQSYRVNIEEGQRASLSLIDTKRERWAYLGDAEEDSKQEISRKFDDPEWQNLKDLKNDVWIGNAIDWIRNSKPKDADYCD
jgi:hypothetical protein